MWPKSPQRNSLEFAMALAPIEPMPALDSEIQPGSYLFLTSAIQTRGNMVWWVRFKRQDRYCWTVVKVEQVSVYQRAPGGHAGGSPSHVAGFDHWSYVPVEPMPSLESAIPAKSWLVLTSSSFTSGSLEWCLRVWSQEQTWSQWWTVVRVEQVQMFQKAPDPPSPRQQLKMLPPPPATQDNEVATTGTGA